MWSIYFVRDFSEQCDKHGYHSAKKLARHNTEEMQTNEILLCECERKNDVCVVGQSDKCRGSFGQRWFFRYEVREIYTSIRLTTNVNLQSMLYSNQPIELFTCSWAAILHLNLSVHRMIWQHWEASVHWRKSTTIAFLLTSSKTAFVAVTIQWHVHYTMYMGSEKCDSQCYTQWIYAEIFNIQNNTNMKYKYTRL